MAVNWKKLEEVQSNVNSIGTLQTLAGAGAKLIIGETNFANPEVRVKINVQRKDGLVSEFYCSPRVSKGLRDKSITRGQLIGFPVTEQVTRTVDEETGAYVTINVITMPTGAKFELDLDAIVVEEFKATAVNHQELIAF